MMDRSLGVTTIIFNSRAEMHLNISRYDALDCMLYSSTSAQCSVRARGGGTKNGDGTSRAASIPGGGELCQWGTTCEYMEFVDPHWDRGE